MVKILTGLLMGLSALWLSACMPAGGPPAATSGGQQTSAARQDTAGSRQSEEKSAAEKTAAQTEEKSGVQGRPADRKAAEQGSAADSRGTKGAALAGAMADDPEQRLAAARQKLRLSEDTQNRIRSELEQLKRTGNASAEDLHDYEVYLDNLHALVVENRKVVARMQAAYAQRPSKERKSASAGTASITPDESAAEDEVAVLDRRLNASLDEFDGALLKQMDVIRAESADKMRDLARRAAEAARRLHEKGVAADTAGKEPGQQPTGKPIEDSGSDQKSSGAATAAGDRSSRRGPTAAASEEHRSGYEDDDIVARQLREAAEQETDPELKKKLWKEYEQYKKSKP